MNTQHVIYTETFVSSTINLLSILVFVGFVTIGRKLWCWYVGNHEEISTWNCVVGFWSAIILIKYYLM